jgi:IclR family transcriptional regulator, acetate operon repressor
VSSVKEIRSVRNACALLEAVAERQPLGVSELARVTGIEKSAAHRLAVTLHRTGWLGGTGDGRWWISPGLARWVRRASSAALSAQLRPRMEELRDATGETVMLVAIEDGRLRVREVVESRQALRVAAPVGSELPLMRSSAVRAIAAHLPTDELEALRRTHPKLDDDAVLAQVRRRGWAVNDREIVAEARVVGAPVLSEDGYPLAALIVCGPASRISRARMKQVGELVARAARGSLAKGT